MSGNLRYIGLFAGAAIGGVLAIPTGGLSVYAGAALGASIGSLAGGVLDAVTAPKPESLTEKQLQENLAITSAALGTFIPIIRGRQIVHGNVIDATLKQPHVVEQDTGGGGGGGKGGFGGSSQASRTTTYSITLAIGLCAGPMGRITKAWTDATLVYDEAQFATTGGGSKWTYELFDDSLKTGLQTTNHCTDVHVHRGFEDEQACSILQDIHGVENVQAYRGLGYIVIKDLDLGTSGRVPQFQFEIDNLLPSPVLADTVRDLCLQAGLSSDLIDVTQMPTRHVDFLITNVVAVSSILESLATCYNFIGVESDGKVKFRDKSIATATVIPENLLSGGIDKQNTESLVITRMQDRELPTQVTVTYPDKTRNFQNAAQIQQLTHTLYTTDTLFQINAPVALLPADAKILAETLLYEAWSSRESFAFTLPPRYMMLEPGDAIAVTSRGLEYVLRLTEWTQGENWLAEVKGISYDASVHTGYHPVPGVAGTGFVALPVTAHATGFLLEPPALSSAELEPQLLFIAYTTELDKTYASASLFLSTDGGASYDYTVTSAGPSIVGTVAVALPPVNWYVWDDTTILEVVLYQRALQSVSDAEVLNGKNWAMVGNELIGFRDALLTAPRTYHLTHLLRGRKGTESFVGSHVSNEVFVLVTPELRANNKLLYPRTRIAVSELYKVVDPITSISTATAFSYTPSGISVKPWAPLPKPSQHNTPTTNDITIRWVYRSRTHGELINNSGIAWDIDFTQTFVVTIYTNNTYTTVARTTTTGVYADPNAILTLVYTAAQQTTDFGSPQGTVYVGVMGVGLGILGYEARFTA